MKFMRTRTPEEEFKDIHQILLDSQRHFGSKTFLISADQDIGLSFNQINDYTNKVANFLKDKKTSKESKICIIGKNCVETLIIFFGILRYGAIACPINFEESRENMLRILNRVKPELCLYDNDLGSEWLTGIPLSLGYSDSSMKESTDLFSFLDHYSPFFDDPLGDPEDIAEILFTSGTTEVPKGVAISRRGLFLMVDEVIRKLELTEDYRVLEYRAYSWASTQLLSLFSTLRVGATLILARKFSRSKFPEWLRKYDVTISSGVPTVINILVSDPVQLRKEEVPALKYITSSSAPLSVEKQREFERIYGIRINQMAGMTEAGWMIGNPPDKSKLGSVGTPFLHKQIFIMDEDGRECPEGQEGEVVVQGQSLALGYLNDKGEVDPFPKEGFRTGDMGYKDSEGYVFITGRKKDLIIRGGVNISPKEITDRIMHYPGVKEAVTIGVPDKIYGEEVASFVVPMDKAKVRSEDILKHCRTTLPDFKIPKIILFLDQIPKTERGKISKNSLLRILREEERRTTA
jgi:long-chain acyl-CoA synthetase